MEARALGFAVSMAEEKKSRSAGGAHENVYDVSIGGRRNSPAVAGSPHQVPSIKMGAGESAAHVHLK